MAHYDWPDVYKNINYVCLSVMCVFVLELVDQIMHVFAITQRMQVHTKQCTKRYF